MKQITVKVTSSNKDDNSATHAIIEVDRGAGHVRVDARDIITNKDEEVFNLRHGQRIVIEAYEPQDVAYDRDQGAAYKVDAQKSSDGSLDKAKTNTEVSPEKAIEQKGPAVKPTPSEDPLPGTIKTPAQSETEKNPSKEPLKVSQGEPKKPVPPLGASMASPTKPIVPPKK